MAPVNQIQVDPRLLKAQSHIKDIILHLYECMVQTNGYDSGTGRPSRDILAEKMELVHKAIEILHSSSGDLDILIPQEVIQYVDDGRNPDIYTREFVELARRSNQLLKGRQEAFASFRDILATQMMAAMPGLRNDIKHILNMTGGNGADIEKLADKKLAAEKATAAGSSLPS